MATYLATSTFVRLQTSGIVGESSGLLRAVAEVGVAFARVHCADPDHLGRHDGGVRQHSEMPG